MNLAGLDELLPPAMVSARTRWLWLLFFALFPLAYVGGWMLEQAEEGTCTDGGLPGSVSVDSNGCRVCGL